MRAVVRLSLLRIFGAVCAACLVGPVLAQKPSENLGLIPDRAAQVRLAFVRAGHLRHGVNASIWFAQSANDYSTQRTSTYMDDTDIALIAKLGFDHMRLSIDPEPLTKRPLQDGMNAEFLGRLDKAVDSMLANGLAVIVDVHPEEPYKTRLKAGSDGVDRFTGLWRSLAKHYAVRDAERVVFEVMNEPEVEDPYRWAGIQATVIAAIREVAPKNTIIACGAHWDSLQDMLPMPMVADGNVIYNFHFYEPYEFTHQGAGWATGWWRYTHGVPYPSDETAMAMVLQEVPDAAGRLELERYFLNHWDAHHMRLLIDAAGDWGRAHGVPVTCNEFGAFRDHSEPKARAAWIHDVRTALEANEIGWTMWDYRGNFGVVNKESGTAVPDAGVVAALGLAGR
jgi:endoglucanase